MTRASLIGSQLSDVNTGIGLRKEEIDKIIQTVPDTQLPDPVMPSLQDPIDVYSPATDYGTVSIRDFQ